jgi:hypothetical protein
VGGQFHTFHTVISFPAAYRGGRASPRVELEIGKQTFNHVPSLKSNRFVSILGALEPQNLEPLPYELVADAMVGFIKPGGTLMRDVGKRCVPGLKQQH